MSGKGRSAVIGMILFLCQWLAAMPALGLSISPSPSPDGSYTVTWTATSSFKTRLHEQVGSGAWSVVGTYAAGATSKSFSAKPSGTYSYKTEHCGTYFGQETCWDSESAVSVTVAGTPPDTPSAPDRPSAPGITAGNTYLSVSWRAPADNGADISDYDVRYRRTSDTTWRGHAFSGAGTSTSITGLTNGTQYEVQVRAGNSAGESSWSASGRGTPAGAGSLTVSPTTSTDGSYTVRWGASRCFRVPFGGGRFCRVLQERVGSGGWSAVSGVGDSATSRAFSGKSAGTYSYRMVIATAVVSGPVSVTVTATPARPTASMRWDPDTIDHGDSATLRWSSTDATSCAINGNTRATSGNWTTTPPRSREDTLVCSGDGGTSDEVTASLTVNPTPPDRPAAPTLTGSETGRAWTVSVSWVAPGANGAPITGYDVQYKRDSASVWRDHSVSGTGTSTTITGLTADRTYEVRVQARNRVGSSGYGPSASVTLNDAPDEEPDAPARPRVATGTGSLGIEWTAPADNGSSILQYQLRSRQSVGGSWQTHPVTGTDLSATVSGLTNGTAYEVGVRARNGVGWSDWSGSATGAPLAALAAPTGPSSSTGAHTLRRGAASGATDYEWRARKDSETWSDPASASGASRTFSNVSTGSWAYQVRACNTGGCGDWSASKTVAVTNTLSVTPALSPDGSYTVSWSQSRCYHVPFGARICRTLEERAGASSVWTALTGVDEAATSQAFSGQAAGTYSYRLALGTAVVAGPVDVTVTTAPPPPTAPATPAAPTLTGRVTGSEGTISVSWVAPSANGAPITGYDVQYKRDSASAWDDHSVSGTGTSTTISGLTAGWTYAVRVQARNSVGGSGYGPPASVTLDDAPSDKPDTPSTPTGPSSSTGEHTLSWDAVSGASRYEWRARRGSENWSDPAPVSGTGTSETFSGVPTGAWAYQVRACNDAGCGGWSASKTVTVTNTLSVTPALSTDGNYTVSWNWARCSEAGICQALQERADGSSAWVDVTSAGRAATSQAFSDKASGTYWYRLVVFSGGWVFETAGPVKVTVKRVSALPPPVLSGPSGSIGVHTLRWDAVTGATGYTLRERKDGGAWQAYDVGADTSRAFTGRAPGSWSYQAASCDDKGCGAWSESLVVTVGALPPMSISPSPSTDGSYTVSWGQVRCIAVPFGGGRFCRTLQEQAGESPTDDAWTEVAGVGETAVSQGFSGKASGTYWYRLAIVAGAVEAVVAGPESVTVERAPSVSIEWDPDTVAYGGSSTLSWEAANVESCLLDGVDEGASGSRTDTDLTQTQTSRFTCATGDSSTQTATATLTVTPPAPAKPTASAPDLQGNYTVSWQATPLGARYELQESEGDTDTWSTVYNGAGLSQAFSGKASGEWHYRVRACAGASVCSGWSEMLTVTAPAPPDEPENPDKPATPATPTASEPDALGNYTVSWVGVTGATRYELRERTEPGNWSTVYNGTGLSNAFTDKAGGEWRYAVRACADASVCGDWSGTLAVSVPDAPDAPGAPALTPGNARLEVDWDAPADNGSALTGYAVRHREYDNNDDWTERALTGTDTDTTLTGLTNGTEYEVQVRASNARGDSDWSVPARGTPTDVIATPSGLTGPVGSTGGHTISWNPVAGALRYELQASRDGGASWTTHDTGTATSKEFSALAHGAWTYRVRACDGPASCGGWSATLTVVVGAGTVPGAPAPVVTAASSVVTDAERVNSDTVGTLAGEFRVAESGAATYRIALPLPTGTAGATPPLGLQYNSQRGNGLVGVGWSLDGLSAITRCRQTYAQDGAAKPLTFTDGDRLCLDGARLALADNTQTYGAPGSEYKTETDGFLTVTLKGSHAGQPDYFEAVRKDGSVSTYGAVGKHASEHKVYTPGSAGNPDTKSEKILTWALQRVEDSAGNAITYAYTDDEEGHRLSTISYAYAPDDSSGNMTAQAEVRLSYGTRTDGTLGYLAGYKLQHTQRLLGIAVHAAGASGTPVALRNYRLRYEGGATAGTVSRLAGVKQCVGAGQTTCMDETVFDWSAAGALFKQTAAAVLTLNSDDDDDDKHWSPVDYKPADINGDGVTDLVWTETDNDKENHRIQYALANKTRGVLVKRQFTNDKFIMQYGDDYGGSYFGDNLRVHTEVVDYNADGRMDIIVYSAEADRTKVHLSKPQDSGGWRLDSVGMDLQFRGRYRFADLNSDGLPDAYKLVARFGENPTVPTGYDLEVRYLARASGQTPSSGRYYAYGAAHTLTVPFTQLLPTSTPDNAPPFYQYWKTLEQADLQLADVDGDGRADLTLWGTTWIFGFDRLKSERRLEVFRQTDTGFARYGSEAGIVLSGYSASNLPKGARIADLNQDGLSDLVYFVGDWYLKSEDNYQWTGDWHYRLSTGAGFTDAMLLLAATSAGAQAPSSPSLYDDNGDGYPDFLYHDVPGRKLRVRHYSPALGTFNSTATLVRTTAGEDGEAFFTLDMNGDGNSDLLHVPRSDSGTETLKVYHHNTAGRPHLVTLVTNGLGAKTTITYGSLATTDAYVRIADLNSEPGEEFCFAGWGPGAGRVGRELCWTVESTLKDADSFYTAMNDPWAAPAEPPDTVHPLGPLTDPLTATAGDTPVLELTGPLYVVTRVDSSAPVAGDAQATSGVGYVYERGKVQAAGRGLLGFRTLTTVDLQTGVRTTTTYRQDFPYIGLPLRTQVKTLDGTLLRSAKNTWRLQGYQSAWDARSVASGSLAGTGSARLGALQPYIAESTEKVYALPTTADGKETRGALLSEVTTQTEVDGYGNPTRIVATTDDAANTRRFRQETVNTYGAPGATWEKAFGRLTQTRVTKQRDETGDGTYEITETRSSSFTYHTGGLKRGLLKTEVRDAVNKAGSTETLIPAHTTTYDYDRFGNRVRARVRAASGSSAYSRAETRCDYDTVGYDTGGRFVIRETDCLGRLVRRLGGHNAHGLPTWSERVLNTGGTAALRTTHRYTPGGRRYFSRDKTGAYTGTVWKDCVSGCPAGAAYYVETRQAGGGVAREYRDALDRVVRSQVAGFKAGVWITTDTEYDALGRVARRSEPYHTGAARYWTRYEYDLLGRVIRTTLPDYTPGSGGVNSVITVSYAGLTTTTTNGKGQRQVETRNALGEVIESADHAGTTVRHKHNAFGQVTATTTAGTGVSAVTVEMTYDRRGRRMETDDPDRGKWTYAYNGFDELVKQTDALGNYQVMTYDGMGRLIRREDFTPAARKGEKDKKVGSAVWRYDTSTNGLGQLGSAQFGAGYIRYHYYDSLGRPSQTNYTLDDTTYFTRQTYDGYGRPYQRFDAARTAAAWTDNAVEVQYNARGYAQRWVDGVYVGGKPRTTYRTITAQDARGNITKEALGAGVISATRAFDAKTGRVRSITSEDALARPVQALGYEWDRVGNLTGRTETSVGKALTETFAYDTLNRLISSTVSGRAPQTVRYDALGNITHKSDVGSYTYGTNAGPHAVTAAGSATYTYDANGNQLTGDGRELTYTVFNKVSRIEKDRHVTAFAYGPERARYRRTDTVTSGAGASTTKTYYLGDAEKVIAPDGSYTWKRYVADGALIEQEYDNRHTREEEHTRYLLRDHLGSLDVITDAAGTPVQDMSFDAWGQRRAPDRWTVLALLRLADSAHGSITPYGYTGHEMLDEVGIIHMNGRIYDPKLARFLQADPVIQLPHYSQGWNRYSYVLNNPLNATDPTGYIFKKLFRKLVGAVVNGIFGEFLASKIPALRPFFTLANCALGNALSCAGGAFANAYAGGASLKQALKAGVFAYVSAQVFSFIGDNFSGVSGTLVAGSAGGALAELQGGNFGHGFVAAGIGFGTGQVGSAQGWGVETQFVASVVSAGTVSEITGGKFANGATTAAFAFALSRLKYQQRDPRDSLTEEQRKLIERLEKLGVIRKPGDPYIFKFLAENCNPDICIGLDLEGYAELVDQLGLHEGFQQRLPSLSHPGEFHITYENFDKTGPGIYVHYDAISPLKGPLHTIWHGVREVLFHSHERIILGNL